MKIIKTILSFKTTRESGAHCLTIASVEWKMHLEDGSTANFTDPAPKQFRSWHQAAVAILLYFLEVRRRVLADPGWDNAHQAILEGGPRYAANAINSHLMGQPCAKDCFTRWFGARYKEVLLHPSPGTLGLFHAALVPRNSTVQLHLNREILDPKNVEVLDNGEPTEDDGQLRAIQHSLAKAKGFEDGKLFGGSRTPTMSDAVKDWKEICKELKNGKARFFSDEAAESVVREVKSKEDGLPASARQWLRRLLDNKAAMAHICGERCTIHNFSYTALANSFLEQQKALAHYIDTSPNALEGARPLWDPLQDMSTSCLLRSNVDSGQHLFTFPTFEFSERAPFLGVLPYGRVHQIGWLMRTTHPAWTEFSNWVDGEMTLGADQRTRLVNTSAVESCRSWIACSLRATARHKGRLYVGERNFQREIVTRLLAEGRDQTFGGMDQLCQGALTAVHRVENLPDDMFKPDQTDEWFQRRLRSYLHGDESKDHSIIAFDPAHAEYCTRLADPGMGIILTPLPETCHVPVGVGFSLSLLPRLLLHGWWRTFAVKARELFEPQRAIMERMGVLLDAPPVQPDLAAPSSGNRLGRGRRVRRDCRR